MTRTETILPPRLILAPDVIYAIQGDVYALEPSSGLVQHHYPIEGLSKLAIMNGVLYMNVTNGFSNTVQAVQASDGALLWRYPVDDPLAGKPSIGNGVLYVGTRNGSVLALRVDDGSLLWRYKFDYGPEVPLFKTPILRGSPVVAKEIVYISPSANDPLQSYLYALQSRTGKLLWQVPLPESTTQELTVFGDNVYISSHSMCSAWRASNGLKLWSRTMNESSHIFSQPIVADGELYVSSLQFTSEFSHNEHPFTKHKQVQLHALHRNDGTSLWNTQLATAENVDSSTVTEPAAAQTSILVGSDDGSLSALHKSSGILRWRYQTNSTRLSGPVVSDNVVYIGVNNGSVLALHVDNGTLLWQTPLNGKKITGIYTQLKRSGSDEAGS